MHKKIIVFYIVLLMILLTLQIIISAEPKDNPEIYDLENDCFGSFIKNPLRFKLFNAFGLLTMESYDFMDIKSAWFFEESSEPEYLFASLELKDLEVISQRAIYSMHWEFEGVRYVVGSHIFNNGQNNSCLVGLDKHFSLFCNFKTAISDYDFENDIVTFKFKKEFVGNPQPGDGLENTWAWTALRFNFEPFTILFSDGELVKDAAPFINSVNDYGSRYIIKY